WAPASFSPSVVQLELLHNGLIQDPNIGENEHAAQWPGLVDWEYRCFFPSPLWLSAFHNIELVFDGLDTFATVSVNGQEILTSDNMFLPHPINVQDVIKPPEEINEMTILFECPWKKGVELENRYGVRKAPSGTPKRMHIRKAQCHWGWDFGSRMLSIGPYRPIHLQGYDLSIEDIHISSDLSSDLKKATILIRVATSSPEYTTKVKIDILKPNGQRLATQIAAVASEGTLAQFVVDDPELWWPNGQGEQPLYRVTASLHDHSGELVDSKDIRFGIRTIELVRQPLNKAPGETFMFRANGRNIFAQGGNWVPGDTLLPRMTRAKYVEWIRLAKLAHHNMIRVWGGGIYETNEFWDACDEAGILVWQDFAFACGDYPLHAEFVHNIEREVKAQILRVRNRASLALLCGGNEDFCFEEFIWFACPPDTKGPFENTSFPQRKIYFEILPAIAAELAPNVPYWVNSPWGGKTSSNDPTVGNVHEWNVWHIMQRPYQDYRYLGGRFVTEFGMASHPLLRTLAQFTPDPKTGHPQSRLLACRSKGGDQAHKTAGYLASNIRYDSANLVNFAFATQIVQSEALSFALTHWKRKFAPGNEECAGALIWQMNEVGPAINWSYIDYFLRPKPAFYSIRRALAPLSVGIRRSAAKLADDGEVSPLIPVPKFEIFAHNSTSTEVHCRLILRAYDL
ncbi:glycoside hydrolase family 2 protein, partial [Cadophora sp. DSE1049]